MAPSLSQIHVLFTLAMLSFALEARKECTDHENSWFLQQRQAQDRRAAQWLSFLV